MTFYIIGTGNTAWFLGYKLCKAGHHCKGVWGRDLNKATRLAKHINTNPIENITKIQDDADCCIIAVSDGAIKEIASKLSFKTTVLAHTAGSVSRKILDEAAEHNGNVWPLYSIVKENIPRHNEVPIAVEGSNDEAEQTLKDLVNSITSISYTVSWKQRQALHLCAVLCNNFTNHLMAISEDICNDKRIPFSILYPIIQQTADRICHTSPRKLQTGPAIRNDVSTINNHLEQLEDNQHWQDLYRSVTTSIDKMYNHDKEE